ncbi:hypothetical protein NDA16_001783 [Ustilago loliicola]|nr:hypothetical protein NDA16_001783 [Ustilago loliicola]
MGNLSGVIAVLAVIFRPSLVVPHVQVPDIRHLDWEALHANGVRFLVFDKDNCLTAPHSDVLEPSITEAWERCQRVFGRENILIVSNSSGSSDDPSGLGAESLSRALNVPVLCHKQKKPSSVLTTGIWTYEGRLNALMRKLETRVTSYLIRKGFQPGSPGLISFRRSVARPLTDWQKIASKPVTNPETLVTRLSQEDAAEFAYTRDTVPSASLVQPSLGAVLIATIVRPLPPRLASLVSKLLSSRPPVWISSNLRDGWNVMIKGLEFGVREAGIQPQQRYRKLTYPAEASSPLLAAHSDATLVDEVAPKPKTELKKEAVSASLADYLESRIPNLDLASSATTSGAAQQLRNRLTSHTLTPPAFLNRLSILLNHSHRPLQLLRPLCINTNNRRQEQKSQIQTCKRLYETLSNIGSENWN